MGSITCRVIPKKLTSSPKGNGRSPASQEVQSLDKRKVVGVCTLYGHRDHLGHVTLICYILVLLSYRCFF